MKRASSCWRVGLPRATAFGTGCHTTAAPLRMSTLPPRPQFRNSTASRFFASRIESSAPEARASPSADGAAPSSPPVERLGLLSGSALHERATFGGRDVALLADTYGAIGVFDAVGGWHGAGGSEFARLLERHVQRSLGAIDLVKQEIMASTTKPDDDTDDVEDAEPADDDLDDILYKPGSEEERFKEESDAMEEELQGVYNQVQARKSSSTAAARKKLLTRYSRIKWRLVQVEQLLPSEILMRARNELLDKNMTGVSTALLLILSEKHEDQDWEKVIQMGSPTWKIEEKGTWLHTATMGDPCFMVIRNGKRFYRSTPSYAQFNEPNHFSGSVITFAMDPSIKHNSVKLLKGDIIVVGTNGLFDNVWDDEIVEIVNQTIENTKVDEETAAAYPLEGMIDPEIIAEALVKQATANSTNLEKKSPFAEYAEKEGYIYIGGREDDVTAVVSYVVPQKN